jgi:hypothetical protein
MTRRSFGVALVVALVVSSCTSDDSAAPSTTPATSPDEATETSATATTEPVPDYGDVASVPPGANGETTGPLGSSEIRIATDAGTVQIGTGEVPDRLGPLFPLPSDFEVELLSETATDLGFSGTTSATFDELVELYEGGLPGAGFVIGSFERRDDFAVFEFSDERGTGQVAITSPPGSQGHTLIVTFADGAAGGTQDEN